MTNAYQNAIEVRKAYELSKNAENTSMQSTLDALSKSVAHDRIAEIMTASNYSADRINASERVNARTNVYAIEKDVNVARTVAAVAKLNHYTKAILQTAKKLSEADQLLTHHDAQCACSLSVKHRDSKRDKMIVRYAKHVHLSTANTQSSSSISALQAFGVLTETRDAANVVAYKLNTENATAQALIAAL